MANLSIRRSESAPSTARTWDPARLMREMMGWDPFSEMSPILSFDEPAAFNPDFEVRETKDGYVFRADVPGVKEPDLEIRQTGNRLTIAGKREFEQKEKGDTWYTWERGYGSFSRAFTLPDGADVEHAKAELVNGVVTIQVPKLPEVQSKRISISSGEKKPH